MKAALTGLSDWQGSILAAAGLILAIGVIWKYIVWPFGAALWAAILAAPQIRDALVDLPDLLAGLRKLIDENVIGQIEALRGDVSLLRRELAELRAAPAIGGGAEDPPAEQFMLPRVRRDDI